MISLKPVSTPVLPIWFEIHTNSGLPVKMPVPPRSCVVRFSLTSTLKPTRGDHRILASGSLAESYCTGGAGLVAERQRIGVGVVVARLAEDRHVHAHAGDHLELVGDGPLVLRVGAACR